MLFGRAGRVDLGETRVFSGGERDAIGAEQAAALAELAARVRELNEAVVLSAVETDEVAAVADEVAALTERLRTARRERPPVAELADGGTVWQPASPVTGELNPLAPPVEINASPDGTARCEFTLNAVYEGPPGFVHGGISAMILDQLLGSAAAANGTPGMTATLDMRYRRPTPYGVPLTAEARVVQVEGRKTVAEAQIAGPDGKTTVEATASFIMPAWLLDAG